MKKIWLFIATIFVCVGVADAAVRDTNTKSRTTTPETVLRGQSNTSSQKKNITSRATTQKTISRTATTARSATRTATTARAAQSGTVARTATTARSATTQSARTGKSSVRSAVRPARATITLSTTPSNTFGTGYNTCRDAYFTCMDQFCGTANDTYRRCICSSKLPEIQSRERALSQAADQLNDFKDLNLTVIDKTAAEVSAMVSASDGEYTQSISKDTSDSASKLAGISDILAKSKQQALSTQGQVDIAGDINAIWATTDLTGGTNIANLTGEALYNAVHAQCSELVADKCQNASTQTMVTSAYGMYIENDCSLLINELDKKLLAANGTIRATEREMNLARLDNYNNHNSTAINECIAQVRQDITAETACGTDYVHCLDITGLYLNHETGEPIYSPNFYQLESQLSLSGDILTNQSNRLLVAELNRMRPFAARGLDTCRDIADDVWDEFVRQAITEIYQGQHDRIRQVKSECLDVVNACYDTQQQSLKDFSNIKDQLLLGSRLELSEEMCREKLDACSNLYGGGSQGMLELLTTMHNITSQQIAKECLTTLQDYAKQLCAVPSNDTLHGYPYACRVYAPGDQIYATNHKCNLKTNISTIIPSGGNSGSGGDNSGDDDDTPDTPTQDDTLPSIGTTSYGYVCTYTIKFTTCDAGYFLSSDGGKSHNGTPVANNNCYKCWENYTCAGGTAAPVEDQKFDTCPAGTYMTYNGEYDPEPKYNNACTPCPEGYTCAGGLEDKVEIATEPQAEPECGTDYVGSLYHKMVRYAMQTCVRPSEANLQLPSTVLQDVNVVMDKIRIDMANALSAECERLDGLWVDSVWIDTNPHDNLHDITGHTLHKNFYSETSANTKWGYCTNKESTTETNTETQTPESDSTPSDTDNGTTTTN